MLLHRRMQEKEKISTHKEKWIEEAAKEEERLQDLEMEEFRVRPLDIMGDGDGNEDWQY
jgi:hypothetical protein